MNDEIIDSILPSCIDNTHFNYIKVDNKYVSSIYIVKLPQSIEFGQIMDSIPKNFNYDMSFFITKKNSGEVLKELTYCISSNGVEVKSGKNQLDVDIVNKVREDAKNLRREIQINNEEVYYVCIVITLYNEELNTLMRDITSFRSKLYSKNIISYVTNFRHLNSYTLNLPFGNNDVKLLKNGYSNITTSTLSCMFPFYIKNILDEFGTNFGYTHENKLCNIDIFSPKYMNSNICIFGSSGAGKSYFLKLYIIRSFLNGIRQYIFDIEGEYVNIVQSLGGTCITFGKSNNRFNILEIFEPEIKIWKDNVIDYKIEQILRLISNLCDMSNDKEIQELKNDIKLLYNDFNINNKESLYTKNDGDKIFLNDMVISSQKFPTLLDLYEKIKKKKVAKKLKEFIIDKYDYLCEHSNINLSDKLFVFDFAKISNNTNMIYIAEYFFSIIRTFIDCDKSNNLIYIDEVWKYICIDKKSNLTGMIYDFFKTIRKKKAGIVVATQDISDFFTYENGEFGKSILNNSQFKLFFKMEYINTSVLNSINMISKDVLDKILNLKKGQTLLNISNCNILLDIKSSDYENEIIEGEYNENNSRFK